MIGSVMPATTDNVVTAAAGLSSVKTAFDRYRCLLTILDIFRAAGMLTESGCESRVEGNRHVLFAARSRYSELAKRLLLNVATCDFLRHALLAIGPVQELRGICDKLMFMLKECMARHLSMPFDDSDNSGDTVSSVSLSRQACEAGRFRVSGYVLHVNLQDFKNFSDHPGLLLTHSTTVNYKPVEIKDRWLYADPAGMNSPAWTKRIDSEDEKLLLQKTMNTFWLPEATDRFVQEFFRARRRIEDKERNRLYERTLTSFVATNNFKYVSSEMFRLFDEANAQYAELEAPL